MDTQNCTSHVKALGPPPKLLSPTSHITDGGVTSHTKTIVNLSQKFTLSTAQHTLLNKGLTFIPTLDLMKDCKKQLKLDLQTYHRRIKLECFFEGKNKTKKPPFTPKSNWSPKLSQLPPSISQIIRADEYAFQTLNWGYLVKPNLEKDEFKALKQLRSDKHIVLKPADKGNAVVIMDRDQYIWEGERQLNNKDHYVKLQEPIYLNTVKEVQNILDELVDEKYLNKKQRQYLTGNCTPRPRLFYLLPKIHKDKKDWSKPGEIPPGRPIVSDCGSETYFIAEYIEYFLNPISQKHSSYLKDTYDFIDKISQLKIPPGAFLFTIDIDSLYTNIETTLGMKAIQKWLEKYPDPNRPDKQLLQLLHISLTKNDFEFNSEYYLQIKGTAMGKKFAPSYANIFMADWEESALETAPLQPLFYYRFLDDIWGIWNHSKEEFTQFTEHLNTHTTSIKIKHTFSDQEVNFLDTVTYKGQKWQNSNCLDIKIYFKETDSHSLLYKTSYHPRHTYSGIVKSQLLRFHRICSDKEHFYEATKVLFSALRKRGYSRSFLRRALKDFLKVRIRSNTDMTIIPLVATFSKASLQLNRLAKSNFQRFLLNTEHLQKHTIISAFRRNRNLKDLLVKSRLPSLNSHKPQTTHAAFQLKRWVSNHSTRFVYRIKQIITPQTPNCIYLISCVKCRLQYVGQTKNTIMTRLYQHMYNITNHKETQTYIVSHFIKHGLSSLRIAGIQHNPHWSLAIRLTEEKQWIDKLSTIHPRGLNEQ